MDSGSSDRLRSSREQVSAHYTSVRHSANRRETVEALHWDLASSRSQAAKRVTYLLAQSTQAVQGLTGERKRQQMAQGQSAGGRISGLLPAEPVVTMPLARSLAGHFGLPGYSSLRNDVVLRVALPGDD